MPRPFVGVAALPRYVRQWSEWSRKGGAPLKIGDSYPCLGDATATTGIDPHYFQQAAWLARRLAATTPKRHVDVGSSVQMLGVISGFVPVTFVDIRPLETELSNFDCIPGSILDLPFADRSLDSISCLHVIEHIGLGRYGDPIDPTGSVNAARELARVVMPGGRLFLSTPVGRARVCFNAHRVFNPSAIVDMVAPLRLEAFSWVGDDGVVRPGVPSDAAGADYGCGFFEFRRDA